MDQIGTSSLEHLTQFRVGVEYANQEDPVTGKG